METVAEGGEEEWFALSSNVRRKNCLGFGTMKRNTNML